MAASVLALHVIGWFILVVIVAPEHYSLGTKSFASGSVSPPTPWVCGTPSTPTTSPPSTTPPAS